MTTHDFPVIAGNEKLSSVGSCGRVALPVEVDGVATVSVAEPVMPFTVARTVAVPAERPVAVVVAPLPPEMAATLLPDASDQLTDTPLRIAPDESRATAVACELPPGFLLV